MWKISNFPRCSQYSFEPSAALIVLIIMTKMQIAVSSTYFSSYSKSCGRQHILSHSIQQNILLKVESILRLCFPFFTEENTWLGFIHTMHKGKEANHPNFRDSKFHTITECHHCYAEWSVSIYMQIYKWFCFVCFFLIILSIAHSWN